MRALLLTAAALAAALALHACDPAPRATGPYDEGDAIPVRADGPALPASREGYARLAAFVMGGSYVVLVDPGTGPDDPPRFARAFSVPEVIAWTAQLDADGFLWLAAPDDGGGAPMPQMYVVDPHRAAVQREIELPDGLHAVAHVAATPDAVYLRPWRNGFSGAVGRVDRACATDAARCAPSLLVEFGNVGLSGDHAFHVAGDTLYSFSNGNSRDQRTSLDVIDLGSGSTLRSGPFSSSNFVVRPDAIHMVANSARGAELVRINPQTLVVEARRTVDADFVARQGARVYTARIGGGDVKVYDAASLSPVESIPVALESGVMHLFSIVAPDVLLLDAWTALDLRTNRLLDVGTPRLFNSSNGLVLPQGHPLAR